MNIDTFFDAPVVIQLHAGAAIGALGLGLAIYTVARGRRLHQVLGISCAALLVVTAVTAIFIRTSPDGSFSWIHGFIPLTLLGIFGVVMGLAGRNRKRHRDSARGLIFGALLVPGIFTLIPGRLMHTVLFG